MKKKHNGLWARSMKTEQNKQLDNSYQCDNLNNLDLKKNETKKKYKYQDKLIYLAYRNV